MHSSPKELVSRLQAIFSLHPLQQNSILEIARKGFIAKSNKNGRKTKLLLGPSKTMKLIVIKQ